MGDLEDKGRLKYSRLCSFIFQRFANSPPPPPAAWLSWCVLYFFFQLPFKEKTVSFKLEFWTEFHVRQLWDFGRSSVSKYVLSLNSVAF